MIEYDDFIRKDYLEYFMKPKFTVKTFLQEKLG